MKKRKRVDLGTVGTLVPFPEFDLLVVDPVKLQVMLDRGDFPISLLVDFFGEGEEVRRIDVIGPHIRIPRVPKKNFSMPESSPDRRVGMVVTRLPQNPVRRAVRVSGVDAELAIQRGDVDVIDSILATRDS